MMLWCELHNSSGVKGGITNFDPTEYEKDLQHLSSVTQARPVRARSAPCSSGGAAALTERFQACMQARASSAGCVRDKICTRTGRPALRTLSESRL